MMEKQPSLPFFGVFSLLTVCAVFCAAIYSRFTAGSISLPAFAAAQAAAAIVSAFAALTCFRERKEQEKKTSAGSVILAVCLAYLTAARLSEFALFLGAFTHMSLRFAGFIAALLAVSLIAGRRGIAAVCRCAVILFAGSVFVGTVGCALLSANASYGLSGETASGGAVLRSSALALSELSALAALSAFSGQVTGKGGRLALILGSVVPAAFAAALSLLSFAVLGRGAVLCDFPFYTAAQAVGVGSLRRLDVLFLCARCHGAFLLLSLLMCAQSKLFTDAFGQRRSDVLTFAAAAVSGGCVYPALISERFRTVLLSPWTTSAVIVLSFAVPLLLSTGAKKRSRRAAALAAVITITAVLSGCEKVQLQDRMIIKGVGLDIKDGEYLVTVQYLDNYSDGDKQENKVISVIGKSVSEALGRLKDSTGSEPFLGQTSAVVIGSETAGMDILPALTYFTDYSEIRPTARLYISETTALDLLTAKQDGKLVPIDHLTAISPSGSDDGRFTLLRFTNAFLSPTDTPCAAVLGQCEGTIRLSTVAYISGGKSVPLSEEEYLAYCLLLGLDSESVVRAESTACEVVKCRAKQSFSMNSEKPAASLACDVRLSVLENPESLTNDELSALFSQTLTELCSRCAKRTLNSGSDIYGVGRSLPAAQQSSLTQEDYENALRSAEVSAAVKCCVGEAKALR